MPENMSNAEITASKQRGTPFKPGQSGNPAGRPKGSRNRLAEQFVSDLANCWEKHGTTALEACALTEPATFCRVVASLLPKQAELNIDIEVMHDVTSKLEAFRTLSEMLGADPASGLRRLKRIAPQIEHER